MAEYMIYLRIPNIGIKTYILNTSEDTIKDIYRYVRDIGGIPFKMMYIPKLRKISMKDRILDHFDNNESFDIHYRLLAGPEKQYDEILKIYINLPKIWHVFYVRHSSDETIKEVIKNALDIVDRKYPMNYLPDEIELVHENKILHSDKELAFYKDLSRSYLKFIPSVDLENKLLYQDYDYYKYLVFGEKPKEVPKLILRLKTQIEKPFEAKCLLCSKDPYQDGHLILPKCRHLFCKTCLHLYVKSGHLSCPKCYEKI